MNPNPNPVIETHPFAPVLPPQATVMMMGTFPPKDNKRAMQFHYPNFQNDMWRIYGEIFFGDKTHFQLAGQKAFDAEKITAFLHERGIASCPTVWKAIRTQDNASDRFLQVVETVDLPQILAQIPDCRHIGTTGGKATEVLLGLLPEKVNMPPAGTTIPYECGSRTLSLTRLPSTSRAYPLSFEKKAAAYRAFFISAGLLEAV